MNKTSKKEIIKLFGYSKVQRDRFKYIDIYMQSIDNWLLDNEFSREQSLKYMLAGVFLIYRSCNHTGTNLTTKINDWHDDLKHRPDVRNKLELLRKYLGRDIESTQDYLSLMNLNSPYALKKITDDGLYQFVITGKLMNA